MTQKLRFFAAALTSVCLSPLAATAQDQTAPPTQSTEIDLGAQWVGGSNTGLYGRYNGFTEQGFDVLDGFSVQNRPAWDSGKTFYFDVTGLNLDFQTGNRLAKGFHDSTYANSTGNDLGPTAEISVSFGDQGKWGVTADYNAISYTGNIIDSIYTVNGATGTLNNGFPAWGGATNAPLHAGPITSYTTTTLSPAEQQFQVGTRRDILQFGAQYILGDDWTINTNVRHEHKEGTFEESYYGAYGGMAFTMPVDYDTDRFDVSASYNTPDLQAVLQYAYFRFTDNDLGVSLPSPVSIASLSASSGPYAQTSLYATPPSNSAHYVTAMLGDNLTPKTRITLNGRFGVELQDNTFPANSGDPNLSSTLGNPTYTWFSNLNSLNQGTSAASPDEVAWIYQGNFAVTSELATHLDGKVSYSFDGRDVHLNQYLVYDGGHGPDATANPASPPNYVVPQNWFNQTAKVELGYLILPESNTKLTANYSFNDINRTNAQVEHSITNTESLELSSMLGRDALGRVTYEHADRTGTLINGIAWGNLNTGLPETYDTPSGAYYQAPMTSDSVILRVDYAPVGNFSGGLFLKYLDERYHYPAIPGAPAGLTNLLVRDVGITRDTNFAVGPDINYRPNEDVNLHLYYTYQRIFYDNIGNGGCAASNTGACAGSVGYFQNKYASSMNTAGVSADWQASSKLKFKSEYNMSEGDVAFNEFNGVQVAAPPSVDDQNVVSFPNIHSVMHELRLAADYQLTDNVDWSLMYQFSMFHNNDWDDLAAPVQATTNTSTKISILTPGYASPNYNVSTIGIFVRVRL